MFVSDVQTDMNVWCSTFVFKNWTWWLCLTKPCFEMGLKKTAFPIWCYSLVLLIIVMKQFEKFCVCWTVKPDLSDTWYNQQPAISDSVIWYRKIPYMFYMFKPCFWRHLTYPLSDIVCWSRMSKQSVFRTCLTNILLIFHLVFMHSFLPVPDCG